MPRVYFTAETARIAAKKSHSAESVRFKCQQAVALRHQAIEHAADGGGPQRLSAASIAAKQKLSDELLAQISLLGAVPPSKLSELRNTPDGEGRASLAKRLVETASQVYGWESEKGNPLVIVGLVSSLDPDNAPPAIEVAS